MAVQVFIYNSDVPAKDHLIKDRKKKKKKVLSTSLFHMQRKKGQQLPVNNTDCGCFCLQLFLVKGNENSYWY